MWDNMAEFGKTYKNYQVAGFFYGMLKKNGYNKLENLKNAFNIANMTAIYNSTSQFKTHLKYFSENENKIIRLVAPRFEHFIKRFSKNSLSEFQLELAKFFSQKHNFALAYIALAEAIVTSLCEKICL